MNWNKFAGPAILAGLPIVLFFGIEVVIGAIHDDGDTISPGSGLAILGMYLLSFFSCLGSIVWFAFALGIKTQDTVSLAQSPNESQHSSVPLASDSQSAAVPTTIDGGYVSHVPEKIILTKSGDDKAQMVGTLIIAGSVVMFVLMIIVGFFWILSGMGSGLGGSGGTCDKTCESLGSAAKFSMWVSILLFPCGVIALARPWSWFSSSEDFHSPVGKVRAGIVAGIAVIATISFGWPALLVIGIGLIMYATSRRANV